MSHIKTQAELLQEIHGLSNRICKLEKSILSLSKSSTSNSGLGYLIYTALLTQTGTNVPVVTVLENTIGNIVWTYGGQGLYIATLVGAFTVGKTVVFVGTVNSDPDGIIVNDSNNINEVWINSAIIQVGTVVDNDDLLSNTPIEIRVYP